MTPKFELGRDFCTMHLPPSFIILRLLVRKLSCWQTNPQTKPQTNRRRWEHPTLFATLRRYVKFWWVFMWVLHCLVLLDSRYFVPIYLSIGGCPQSPDFFHWERLRQPADWLLPGVAYLQIACGQTVGVCNIIVRAHGTDVTDMSNNFWKWNVLQK